MRILHIIPYMHPSAGGPPAVVESFVRETNGLGHTSEIISTSLFCDGDQDILLKRLNEQAPTTFISGGRGLTCFQPYVRRCISRSIRNSDIVHLHTLWNPIGLVARQECERHSRPYVLMPHGML